MAELLEDRYELLETLGVGGEARVVKALDRQHGRLVALKIRTVRDARRARGAARRGARPARHRAAPGAAPGARGLLRRRQLRRRDGLGRRHRPGDAAARSRPAGARAVERARVPGPGGRGADAPALPGSAGDPRRREAGEPDPDQGRAGQARRLRHVVGPGRPAPPDRHAGLPRARARRRRQRPRAPATSTRWPRPRSRCSRARRRRACCPGWDGIDPAQAEQLEGAIRLGLATDPARRPATPGELVERLRGGLGRRPADRRHDVLPVRHRGLDRDVGLRSRRDGRGARPPRRADRRPGRVARRPLPEVDGRGRLHGLGLRLGAAGARGGARGHAGAGGRALAERPADRPFASGSTPARRSAAGPTTSARRSTSRRGCAGRPTAARSSCRR